jgi:NAD(P)H-hydrate repair Nnr-like enzyme with NAD(P)H-hydrate dehydratase domain
VLAGLVGARMAQGLGSFEAACCAVAQHGQLANDWPDDLPLTASALAQHLR